ncbi:hypothetical protein O7N79_004630 [Salmonella enterica]|nr:hypothetical protein [Salmonella enterica]EKH3110490.1 hypothetical protein [Salmonella enterica]
MPIMTKRKVNKTRPKAISIDIRGDDSHNAAEEFSIVRTLTAALLQLEFFISCIKKELQITLLLLTSDEVLSYITPFSKNSRTTKTTNIPVIRKIDRGESL